MFKMFLKIHFECNILLFFNSTWHIDNDISNMPVLYFLFSPVAVKIKTEESGDVYETLSKFTY